MVYILKTQDKEFFPRVRECVQNNGGRERKRKKRRQGEGGSWSITMIDTVVTGLKPMIKPGRRNHYNPLWFILFVHWNVNLPTQNSWRVVISSHELYWVFEPGVIGLRPLNLLWTWKTRNTWKGVPDAIDSNLTSCLSTRQVAQERDLGPMSISCTPRIITVPRIRESKLTLDTLHEI